MSADEGKQIIVDNTSSDVHFLINPQYVNVTDRITQEAFDLVKAAETTAYEQSLADITTPKWSFEHQFHGTSCSKHRLRGNRLVLVSCGRQSR